MRIPFPERIPLPPVCAVMYLSVVLGLFLAILHRDNGVFSYTLDDAYIHLALAENLAHGHYGINPGEASSPSSSIVWPFLLVPLVGTSWHVYLPLIWNILFCGTAAWLIGRIIDGWDLPANGNSPFVWGIRFTFSVLLMLITNLEGLTFVGMEHGLQILLAIACAAGMVETLSLRPMPVWCLGAAVLGPMARYENFALVAALAIALYGLGRWRTALAISALSIVGPSLFSLFLLSHGLPPLPSSVLVKANVYAVHGGPLRTAFSTLRQSIYSGMHSKSWFLQFAVAMVLVFLVGREKVRARKFVLFGTLTASVLQLLLGRYNWFHRYEVYAIAFSTIVACAALVQITRQRPYRTLILIAGLLVLALPYIQALYDTPVAASNVYQQQYQMHRFESEYYQHTIAVNDLGWISYQRPPGASVLDLWGLASPEASRQTVKNAYWLDATTHAHGAGLAIIYPGWYSGIPGDWQALGTMCMTSRPVLSQRCVVFYSTALGDKTLLTAEMAAFARTLPTSVTMALGKDTTDPKNVTNRGP